MRLLHKATTAGRNEYSFLLFVYNNVKSEFEMNAKMQMYCQVSLLFNRNARVQFVNIDIFAFVSDIDETRPRPQRILLGFCNCV